MTIERCTSWIDSKLGTILRDILYVMAKLNVYLEVKHFMGEKNPIMDALSRVHMQKNSRLCPRFIVKGLQSELH